MYVTPSIHLSNPIIPPSARPRREFIFLPHFGLPFYITICFPFLQSAAYTRVSGRRFRVAGKAEPLRGAEKKSADRLHFLIVQAIRRLFIFIFALKYYCRSKSRKRVP